MARPRYHVLVTLPVAWQVRRHLGVVGALAVAAMGVLIDGDHLADWAWMRATGRRDKFLSPLHAWELLALAGVTAAWLRRGTPRNRSLLAQASAGIAFGWWLHMIQDLATNRPDHAGAYSILNRIWHGFDRDSSGWKGHKTFHQWGNAPWWTWL